MNNSINLLIKPTHKCNLNCEYCYEKEARNFYGDKTLRIEALDKLLNVFTKQYKNINIIWHGGEPLLAGEDWYNKAYNVIEKYKDNNVIKCSMQSNGILYDEYKDMIEKYNIDYSISYDYINNNSIRCFNQNLNPKIQNLHINTISVIDLNSIDKIIEQYEFNKDNFINNSMNHIFIPSDIDLNELRHYIEKYKEFLTHVFFDYKNIDNYEERMSINYFKIVLGYKSVLCEHKECLTDFYCLDVDENVYHCDRFSNNNYVFCNINDIDYVTDIYNTDGFKKFKMQHLNIKKECQSNCEIFSLCNGGCIANRIIVNENMRLNNSDCLFIRSILLHCFELVKNIKDIASINPVIYRLMWKKGYVSLDDCSKLEYEGELW